MPTNEDIVLRFLLDSAALGQTERGLGQLEKHFERFQKEIEETKKSIQDLRTFSNDLGNVFKATFLLGTAVSGGIFAAANKYVKDAEKATAVTIAWKASQDSLNKSGARFGAVFAEQALPLLEKAAGLAEKAA